MLTADGEVYTNEVSQVYVRDLNLFVTVQLLEERQQSHHWENSEKSIDSPMSGSTVIRHDWRKTGKPSSAKQTISYLLSYQGYPPIL